MPTDTFPSSSAVVIPSSVLPAARTRAARPIHHDVGPTCCLPSCVCCAKNADRSATSEDQRRKRGADEQQHDRGENGDRRHEHRGATLCCDATQVFAARVPKVLAQCAQRAGEIDPTLCTRCEQL